MSGPGTPTMQGRRVLVVGASSGIGQAFAIYAVAAGAHVAMVARRAAALEATIETAGGGDAIVANLRVPDDCARIAEETARLLGTVDLVFVAAAAANLRWLDEATGDDWAVAFETNVIGFNMMTTALLPILAPGAIVAACSSETVGHPRSGLVPYGASKAALEETLRGWRLEHPEFRFSCVAVGSTVPTDFGTSWDIPALTRAMDLWARHGLAQAEFMRTDDVAALLVAILGVAIAFPGVGVEQLTVRSPSGVVDNAQSMHDAANKSNNAQ